MISSTDLFYTKARQFQDKRSEVMEKYEREFQAIERFKGSTGYQEEAKSLEGKKEAELTALIEEFRPGLYTVLGGMMDAIGKRSVSAPTGDQVNLLSVLRMKKRVTLEECRRTAEAVKDNPIAVSVVTEIAHDHGIMQSFDHLCPEMSSQRASDVVTGMKVAVEDFLQHDTTRASRLARDFNRTHYGATDGTLTKRKLFTDKASCFSDLAGLGAEDLRQFSEIVDGGSR